MRVNNGGFIISEMNLRFSMLCLIGVSFFAAPHLHAASNTQLVGVGWSTDNSPLYAIDTATGSGQPIGLTGTIQLNSLARNSSGVLYSIGGPIPTNRMVTINPTTGLATFVTLTSGGNADFRAIAFSSDDTLYGIAEGNPDSLVTINPGTGVVSAIGPLGVEGIQGLDFAPNGSLYGWDVAGLGLVTINQSTGQATDVNAAFGSDESIQSIAFDIDGMLYGAEKSLFRINPATGETTLVGSGGFSNVRGLEFIEIPEPTTIASAAIGFIALVGLRAART